MNKPQFAKDQFNAIPMQNEHIGFVYEIKNCKVSKKALHGADISLDEWRQVCQKNLCDPDEAYFIIRNGDALIAWLKVNGLQNKNSMAWISMYLHGG